MLTYDTIKWSLEEFVLVKDSLHGRYNHTYGIFYTAVASFWPDAVGIAESKFLYYYDIIIIYIILLYNRYLHLVPKTT